MIKELSEIQADIEAELNRRRTEYKAARENLAKFMEVTHFGQVRT